MIHPFNEYFEKVYVISIQRNKDRLATFIRLHPNLIFEVFEGVDGKELFPELQHVWMFPIEFFTKHDLLYERCRHWNKGQLGCAMSNLMVQKKIIEKNLNRVLILEDDAFIINNRLDFFANALDELPPDWDLFYLGFNPPSKWSENRFTRFVLRIKHIIQPRYTEDLSSGDFRKRYFSSSFSRHLNKPGVYAGTHAYALSFEGAKKVVQLDTPLQYGFDTTLMYANYNKLLNSYSLKKQLIIPNDNFKTSLIN